MLPAPLRKLLGLTVLVAKKQHGVVTHKRNLKSALGGPLADDFRQFHRGRRWGQHTV